METITNTNQLKLMVTTVQELLLTPDMDTMINIATNVARELTGADGVTFVLREDDHCYYADEVAIDPLWKGQRFPINTCIAGWAMLNKRAVSIEDIYSDEQILNDRYRSTFVKSLVMVPVKTAEPIGAIGAYWAEGRRPSENELNLLQSLADIVATSFENRQSYSELENKIKERTAELQAVNKELESFAYSVSHDLRAPLRAVNGYLNILSEDYGEVLDDEAKRIIRSVVDNAEKMNSLIDGLLQFSRTGKKELVKTKIPMKELVSEICKEQKEQDKDRNIEIIINDLIDTIADETLVKQVWTNYISNAIKFTGHKPTSQIEIGCEESPDATIYYVKDNGAGFNMEYHSKLFGVFQRLHSQEEFKGAGVSLAVVQRIILKHGGQVWADSKVNEGATFYFSLPNKALVTS